MKFMLLPPTGVCEEVFRSFTSVEARAKACGSSKDSAVMLPLLPCVFLFLSVSSLPPLLLISPAPSADAVAYAVGSLLQIVVPRLFSANILAFELRARDPGVSR